MGVVAMTEPARIIKHTLHCSFCDKTQHEVQTLVAGPDFTFICDECIDIASDIIQQKRFERHQANMELIGRIEYASWFRS